MFSSDLKLISEKLQNFQLKYAFIIIPIITFSFFIRGFRWMLFLKYLKINIGIKNSFGIYFAGMAFGVTPAKVGELIKSQILKNKYSIAISKTAPIIFVERYYDFKRANGYSEMEISGKRNALENVLITDTLDFHHQRLATVGFDRHLTWFQFLNFASIIAFK